MNSNVYTLIAPGRRCVVFSSACRYNSPDLKVAIKRKLCRFDGQLRKGRQESWNSSQNIESSTESPSDHGGLLTM